MANYAILRMEKRKISSVTKICKHHERLKKEYKSNPDIDLERSHLNYHIIAPDRGYRDIVLNRIEKVGARRRVDSVVMMDVFVGATPDWIKSKTPDEQREYFIRASEFFKQKVGEENIVSAVVHMDEATPHMHLCFVPIVNGRRLSAKDIIGGPTGLSKWQDEFFQYMSERYPDLTRGTPARVTQRVHVPGYLFKNVANLFDHYGEIVQAINDIGMIRNGKQKEAALALLRKYAPEMAKLKDQLKTTDDKLKKLESEVKAERSNTRYYRDESEEKDKIIWEKHRDLIYLNEKQKKLEKLISRISPEMLEELRIQELAARRERRDWER